jgi:hypothetical protein
MSGNEDSMTLMKRALLGLLLAAAPWGLRAAAFSMPLVDVEPNQVTVNAMVAVWSATNASVTAGTTVGLIFPPGHLVPAGLDPGACECIFLRHTSTSAGAWAANEVTFTAGTNLGDGSGLLLGLPADLYPGKFYVRLDFLAGMINPAQPGLATLAIVDPAGNTTLSQGYYIAPSSTASTGAALGAVSGTVKDSNGKPLPAALVLASNDGAYLPVSIAARRQWVAPMSTTANAYSSAAGSDGGYVLNLPPGAYLLQAQVWRHKDGLLQSAASSEASVTVSQGGTLLQDFTLSPLP